MMFDLNIYFSMVMGQTYTLTHRRTQPTIVQDIHISNLITDQNFNIQTDRKLRPSIEHLSNQELTSLINNKQWQWTSDQVSV